jgi:hypothetical protein
MSHDLVAELQGYRNELASAERRGDTDRAAAIRAEVDRVSEALRGRVESLRANAEEQVHPDVARIEAALADLDNGGDEADASTGRKTRQRTASSTTPNEKAVPPSAKKG